MKILLTPNAAEGGGTATVTTDNHTRNTGSTGGSVVVGLDQSANIRAAEQNRCKEILAVSKQHCVSLEEAHTFIAEGRSVDEFCQHILETRYNKPKPVDTAKANLGMSDKDVRRYSICRALDLIARGKAVDGLEGEMSEEARTRYRREFAGQFTVPTDVLNQRAMSSGTATSGGFLVDDENRASDFIEILRNKTEVIGLGATVINGLTGNVSIPRQTGSTTAYWVSEAASITASDLAIGQIRLVPHGLAGRTVYSKELVAQASLDVENLVRMDIAKQLAIAKDLAAISGGANGAAGQPLGITQTTSVGSVTYGGSPTWAKIVENESTVAAANADAGSMAFLISPSTRGKWKTTVKVSSQAFFLMEPDGSVNGYRAGVSQQMAASGGANHKSIFGDWSQLILASWAGLDITVDPYSLSSTASIALTAIEWCDIAVRQPTAFVVSSDAANQ